jgi:hypothetical protein
LSEVGITLLKIGTISRNTATIAVEMGMVRSRFGSPVQNYEIQVLSESASLELLRVLVSDERIDQDLETAKQVCEWLGYLPLGLELVGPYLARKKGVSIATLWARSLLQQLQNEKS